jgi:hypothetical protein
MHPGFRTYVDLPTMLLSILGPGRLEVDRLHFGCAQVGGQASAEEILAPQNPESYVQVSHIQATFRER